MFWGSQILAYFSPIGSAKSNTIGTSSSRENNEGSANEISFGAIGSSHGTPIAIGKGSQIDGSEATLIALLEGNSIEGSHSIAKRLSNIWSRIRPCISRGSQMCLRSAWVCDSVCNRPWLCRRSNVIVKLILPFQMGVPVGVVELGAPLQIQPNLHDLSSDNDLGFVL
jgi:hypothetical protein